MKREQRYDRYDLKAKRADNGHIYDTPVITRTGVAVVATALDGRNPPRYFSLFNNLPYIRHLEYGLYPKLPKKPTGKTVNGYSVQAPQGMFRLACAKWESIVKQVSKDENQTP